MKPYLTQCLLSLMCSACHPLHHTSRLQKIPDGTWVCDQDTLSRLIFKGDQVFSYYDGELIDSSAYTLTRRSCDASYMPESRNDAMFLSWYEDLCHEVRYLTKRDIALIYTARGNLMSYHWVKKYQSQKLTQI